LGLSQPYPFPDPSKSCGSPEPSSEPQQNEPVQPAGDMDPEQQDWAEPGDWDEDLLLGPMSDDMSDMDEAADAAACYPVPDMDRQQQQQ